MDKDVDEKKLEKPELEEEELDEVSGGASSHELGEKMKPGWSPSQSCYTCITVGQK